MRQDDVATLLRNPFEIDPQDLERSATALLTMADDPKALARGVQDAQGRDALKLLFAVGHATALTQKNHLLQKVTPTLSSLAEFDGPRAARVGWALLRFYGKLDHFAGVSDAARKVRAATWSVCFGASVHDRPPPTHVLLLGETGTGKELIAQALQAGAVGPLGPQHAPNQSINAAMLTRELAGSELFGHVRGAFTNAVTDKKGRLADANGGTFFIDEFGQLAPEVIGQLLRVMSSGEFSRVGSNDVEVVNVRVIAATSTPVQVLASQHGMRDLLARFTHRITLPSLRERPEDIPVIGRALLRRSTRGEFDDDSVSTAAALAAEITKRWLESEAPALPWMDNVRELGAAIERRRAGIAGESAGVSVATVDVPPEVVAGTATEEGLLDWYRSRVLAHTKTIREAASVLGVSEDKLQAWRKKARARGVKV